jgi:hypothetical protein
MKLFKQILVVIFIFVIVNLAIAILANHYYHSWWDDVVGCTGKRATSSEDYRGGTIAEEKLVYFDNCQCNLVSDGTLAKIRNNPNYTVNLDGKLSISRLIGSGQYMISFDRAWKNPKIPHGYDKSTIDGSGAFYFVSEKCGVPNYQIENNFRLMINELPLNQKLQNEMNEKLKLYFDMTQRGWINFTP